MSQPLSAVIWDFDGTLVDTRQKNLNVTRYLIELVRGVSADECKALRSLADYEHALHRHDRWTDFYRVELGMSEAETARAGGLWSAAQIEEPTVPQSYEGIREVLEALDHLPHGIVSLNARDNILRLVEALGLGHHFDEVIGYEAFEPTRHKPAPDALVACIERLTRLRPGTIFYVGDHEADTQCAHNANAHLRAIDVDVEVLSVCAVFGTHSDDSGWTARPHFRAEQPRQILEFAGSLGAVAG